MSRNNESQANKRPRNDSLMNDSSNVSNGIIPCLPKSEFPILVTGVAGFIGSHTAELLLKRGDVVIGIDEVNDYYDLQQKEGNLNILRQAGGSRFTFYKGDICDRELIKTIFEKHSPKRIVHLAARAGVRPSISDPLLYVHSNIEATTVLMEAARTYGCEHFVFASSSSVYGSRTDEIFKETDCVDFPVSPYAATKKACELLSYTFHSLYKIPVTGLRFFTVYGPRGRPDMAPFLFVDKVFRGEQMNQFGDGSSARDYTYIADIVDGIVRSLDRPDGYQIYNLGNGNPVELKVFINTVEELTGKKAVIKVLPDQPGDVPRTAADITKARINLGYNPKTPFAEGLKKTVEYYISTYGSGKPRYFVEEATPLSPDTTTSSIDDTESVEDEELNGFQAADAMECVN